MPAPPWLLAIRFTPTAGAKVRKVRAGVLGYRGVTLTGLGRRLRLSYSSRLGRPLHRPPLPRRRCRVSIKLGLSRS